MISSGNLGEAPRHVVLKGQAGAEAPGEGVVGAGEIEESLWCLLGILRAPGHIIQALNGALLRLQQPCGELYQRGFAALSPKRQVQPMVKVRDRL